MECYRHRSLLYILSMLCSVVLFFLCDVSAFAAANSPIGYWKVVDYATGRTKSIVQIQQTANHLLTGKIIKVFPQNNSASNQFLRPSVGMTILSGLKLKKQQWAHGEILNLKNGKTYGCALHTIENGNKLNVKVHYFINLPFLSESETWERIDLMSG